MNSLVQAVSLLLSKEISDHVFKENNVLVTISYQSVIGSIMVPEPCSKGIEEDGILSIDMKDSPHSGWMNNIPSTKLSRANFAHHLEYNSKALNIGNNEELRQHLHIAHPLFDLVMADQPEFNGHREETIVTWFKDGVIHSGRISAWNFPLLLMHKKNGVNSLVI